MYYTASPGDSLRPHSLGKLVYRVLTKEPYSATGGAGAQSPRTQTWFAMTGPTALYPRCAQNSTTSYRASGCLPCKILDSKAINFGRTGGFASMRAATVAGGAS